LNETIVQARPGNQATRQFAIEDYLTIVRYRIWLLIIPVVTLTLATAVGSKFIKNVYRAQTTVLVSTGEVSGSLIPTTVNSSIEDRVKTVREQVLSGTLLRNIVQTYELYPGMANGPMEDRVARLRASVSVDLHGKDLFEISFMGPDPLTVQNVTNRLAQMFIGETYGDRQKSAKATSEFLAQQMEELKAKLDEQEQRVAEFKRQHIGTLPEQMEANQRSLDRLQSEADTLGSEVAKAQDRKAALESQLAQVKGQLMAAGSGGQLVTERDQLEQMQAQLTQMKQTLTPEHPDVKELQAKINQLRAHLKTEESGGVASNAVTRPLIEQLQQTQLEINSLRKQQGAVLGQIGAITGRVAGSPEIQGELSALTRDLEKMRDSYNDLNKKHIEAKQAEALEAQEKGRQFKIIDEARFPERPFRPNRPRLIGLACTIGLIIGIIAIFVAEHLDHSFRDDEDLASFAGKSVLATIPRFTLAVDEVRRSRRLKTTIGVVAAVGVLLALFVVLRYGFGINPFLHIRR